MKSFKRQYYKLIDKVLSDICESNRREEELGHGRVNPFIRAKADSTLANVAYNSGFSDIPLNDLYWLIHRAIDSAISSGDLNRDSFFTTFETEYQAYEERGSRRYVFCGYISFKQTSLRRVHDGVTILIGSKGYYRFSQQAHEMVEYARRVYRIEQPSFHTGIRVYVSGVSPESAAMRAQLSLNTLRGIWNLSNNLGRYDQLSSGKPTPINKVRLDESVLFTT